MIQAVLTEAYNSSCAVACMVLSVVAASAAPTTKMHATCMQCMWCYRLLQHQPPPRPKCLLIISLCSWSCSFRYRIRIPLVLEIFWTWAYGKGWPWATLSFARARHALPFCTPCRRATPDTALWPFQGWPACKAGGLRPSSTSLETPRRTPVLLEPISLLLRRKQLGGKRRWVIGKKSFYGCHD
jgi:hypothetical protein